MMFHTGAHSGSWGGRKSFLVAVVPFCLALAPGCASRVAAPISTPASTASQAAKDTSAKTEVATEEAAGQAAIPVRFSEVGRESGINFKHHNGSFGLAWTPEIMGPGAAFIDADGDGFQDIFFVNNRDWTEAEIEEYRKGNGRDHQARHKFVIPKRPTRPRVTAAFYRNNGDGTFSDQTRASGLGVEMFGMGACVGDYDNDGRADLYVTGLGRNFLFRNQSRGRDVRFAEVSLPMGVRDEGWSISAAWVDYDRDGRLDLFVSHYLDWSPGKDAWLFAKGIKMYSSPTHYKPVLSTLYRNEGARFRDVSVHAGLTRAWRGGKLETLWGKGMGVAIGDVDNDLWPDIVVTHDVMANHLFRNTGRGGFVEEGHKAGVVYGAAGRTRSGMGADFADFDHTNRESLAVANFASEKLALYQNQGGGLFVDVAEPAGVARATVPYVGFGCLFSDYDNDGWPDLVVSNGHVYERISQDMAEMTFAQPLLLLRNRGAETTFLGARVQRKRGGQERRVLFEEVGARSGEVWQQRVVGRGLAQADFDLDGDPDLLVCVNNARPLLLRNDGGNANNSLRVILRGTKSNRAAIGAGVWAIAGGETLRRRVRSGSSYLSESEMAATFGLGSGKQADTLAVRWPSGKLSQFKKVAAGQIVTIDEDKGIVRRQPLPGRARRKGKAASTELARALQNLCVERVLD